MDQHITSVLQSIINCKSVISFNELCVNFCLSGFSFACHHPPQEIRGKVFFIFIYYFYFSMRRLGKLHMMVEIVAYKVALTYFLSLSLSL